MTDHGKEISMRGAALIAGIALTIMSVAAFIATDGSINKLVVTGNPAATTANILSSFQTYQIGVFSWFVIFIADLFAAWGLYLFFRRVNRDLSLMMAWSRLVYVAVLGAALLHYVNVLLLVDANYLAAMGQEGFQTQVMFSLVGFQRVWAFGLIIFGIHVYFVGYLILKSSYVPKVFGWLLLVAALGYLILETMTVFFPAYESARTITGWIFILPMLSEVALGIWLLIKGIIGFKPEPV